MLAKSFDDGTASPQWKTLSLTHVAYPSGLFTFLYFFVFNWIGPITSFRWYIWQVFGFVYNVTICNCGCIHGFDSIHSWCPCGKSFPALICSQIDFLSSLRSRSSLVNSWMNWQTSCSSTMCASHVLSRWRVSRMKTRQAMAGLQAIVSSRPSSSPTRCCASSCEWSKPIPWYRDGPWHLPTYLP